MNLHDLLEELRKVDEITLMELLGVTSDDLVDAFFEKVDEEQERLIKYFNDEN
jgi:hypothetical protein